MNDFIEQGLQLVRPENEQAVVVGTDDSSLVDGRDIQLRGFASNVMREELEEEYDYKVLAIDVYDPQAVVGLPDTYDLFVQGFGESSDGCMEAVEWSIRLHIDAKGTVVQRDVAEQQPDQDQESPVIIIEAESAE